MRLTSGSPGLAIGDADARYLRLAGGDVVGAVTVTKAAPSVYPADATMPPAYSVAQVWANSGKTWEAFNIEVTDTASGSASKILNCKSGSSSLFYVSKDGVPCANYNGINVSGTAAAGTETRARLSTGTGANGLLSLSSGGIVGFTSGTNAGVAPDAAIGRHESGVVEFNNGYVGNLRDWKARRGALTEYLDVVEMTAPSAPAANTCRLYVEDNGAGKTRLMALFPTGVAQQIAIEP